jgi:hypothetical protein
METYNDIFFISIGTTAFIFFGTLVKYAFRSKCSDISLLWGCIKIHRAVELEMDSNDDEEKSKTDSKKGGAKENANA